ncbi:3-dehydrosphinganine reductase [Pseudocyphellaria aurata]|nr:3-dehydrosphinganine reductase [Pseudocyphellaria aurata]
MGAFQSKNKFVVDKRTVLITGGSAGLGKSAGCLLAKKGANVIIVARDIQKLREAHEEISAAALHPSIQRFHYISADLADPASAPRIIAEATRWNNDVPPGIIWCVAGAAHPGLFIDTPTSILHEQMDTNYFSAATMAHAALRSWLVPSPTSSPASQQPANHIIFTSSIVAFYPLVGYGAYSPAKSALRALSDTLSQELQLYPHPIIKTHTLFPATILSPSLAVENAIKPAVTKILEEGDSPQTPDAVARKCIAALERGEELVTSDRLGWLMRVSALGASSGRSALDVLGGALMAAIMPFIRRDMDGTVRKWGRENHNGGAVAGKG